MFREFHWKNAVVFRGEKQMSVRFRATEEDQLGLKCPEWELNENYDAGGDALLIVQGGEGLPDWPDFEVEEELYDGPSLEVVFLGRSWAKLDNEGLHVYVEESELLVVRSKGLRFGAEELQAAVRFEVMNGGGVEEPPPHGPPVLGESGASRP